jgi:hypothetical protein
MPLRDLNGQPRRPLSNKSINKLLEQLAQILDDSRTRPERVGRRAGVWRGAAADFRFA